MSTDVELLVDSPPCKEGISLYHFETFNLVESIATLYKVTIITIMEGGLSKILSSFSSKDFSQYFQVISSKILDFRREKLEKYLIATLVLDSIHQVPKEENLVGIPTRLIPVVYRVKWIS